MFRLPARLSTYGRIHFESLAAESRNLPSEEPTLPQCGAQPTREGAGQGHRAGKQERAGPGIEMKYGGRAWQLLLFDSLNGDGVMLEGEAGRAASLSMPSLGDLEGRLWAVEPSSHVAALTVFDQPFFGGRAFHVNLHPHAGHK